MAEPVEVAMTGPHGGLRVLETQASLPHQPPPDLGPPPPKLGAGVPEEEEIVAISQVAGHA